MSQKDLPVAHMERRVAGELERITVNQTDYARDPERYLRKGWRITSMSDGRSSDAVTAFMASQAVKEIARAANPNHPARHDARRRWEHQQGYPDIRSRTADAPTFEEIRAMPWRRARDLVREITGQRPRGWAEAERLIKEIAG